MTPKQPIGEEAPLGYLKDAGELQSAIEQGTKTQRKDYGPRLRDFTRVVEEQVPVPPTPGQDPLQATQRPGSRPDPEEQGGVVTWSGKRRKEAGKEIALEFGDGWSAVYHPSAKSYGVPFSHRGTLELHLPGVADPGQIPAHLHRLNLQGEPMGRDEAELVYLERNAWTQGLTARPAYRELQSAFTARVDQCAAEILFQDGMADGADPKRAAAAAYLRAERDVMPQKAAALRDLFEKHLQLAPGALTQSPRYTPAPMWDKAGTGEPESGAPAGRFSWTRFDVDPEAIGKLASEKGRVIGHDITGKQGRLAILKAILGGTGILTAQETRLKMGSKTDGTMSPIEDKGTGGASYLFCRVIAPGKAAIEWDPADVLVRSDWFHRGSDHFGAVNPDDQKSKALRITDPTKVLLDPGASNNEIVFKDGIGLLGPFAPKRIRAGSAAARDELIALCKERGIVKLGKRPVEQVITA